MKRILAVFAISFALSGCSLLIENRFFDEKHRYMLAQDILINNGRGGNGKIPKGSVIYEYLGPGDTRSFYVLFNLNDASTFRRMDSSERVLGVLEAFDAEKNDKP